MDYLSGSGEEPLLLRLTVGSSSVMLLLSPCSGYRKVEWLGCCFYLDGRPPTKAYFLPEAFSPTLKHSASPPVSALP